MDIRGVAIVSLILMSAAAPAWANEPPARDRGEILLDKAEQV